jgi:hypothetical protein
VFLDEKLQRVVDDLAVVDDPQERLSMLDERAPAPTASGGR